MRRTNLVAAGIVMALALAACGSDNNSADTTGGATTTAAAGAETTAAPDTTAAVETTVAGADTTAPAPGDALTMSILFDLKGRGDKSFNDSAAVGLDKAAAEFGYEVTEEVRSGSDEAQLLKKAADGGATLILGVGFAWGEAMAESAAANPDINFAIVDATVDQPNVSGLVFKANEGSFLVGAAAALKSTTGTSASLAALISR